MALCGLCELPYKLVKSSHCPSFPVPWQVWWTALIRKGEYLWHNFRLTICGCSQLCNNCVLYYMAVATQHVSFCVWDCKDESSYRRTRERLLSKFLNLWCLCCKLGLYSWRSQILLQCKLEHQYKSVLHQYKLENLFFKKKKKHLKLSRILFCHTTWWCTGFPKCVLHVIPLKC